MQDHVKAIIEFEIDTNHRGKYLKIGLIVSQKNSEKWDLKRV